MLSAVLTGWVVILNGLVTWQACDIVDLQDRVSELERPQPAERGADMGEWMPQPNTHQFFTPHDCTPCPLAEVGP
jgi:hypothetical protein